MKVAEEKIVVDGPAGKIEVIMERPDAPRGIALIAHPHPMGGGANTNKVAYTLAKTFVSLGYAAFRPNFRGVAPFVPMKIRCAGVSLSQSVRKKMQQLTRGRLPFGSCLHIPLGYRPGGHSKISPMPSPPVVWRCRRRLPICRARALFIAMWD